MTKVCVLIILACYALLLTSCGSQATISEAEAIKAAKDATKLLPSPPSLYRITNHVAGNKVDMTSWPDMPGSNSGQYLSCAEPPCYQSAKRTTNTSSDFWGSGIHVTFTIEWQTSFGGINEHKWKFLISNDGVAKFEGEEGQVQPEMPR